MRICYLLMSIASAAVLWSCSNHGGGYYYKGEAMVVNDTVWFTDCAVEKVYTLAAGGALRQIGERLGQADVAGGTLSVECRGRLSDNEGRQQLNVSKIYTMQPGACDPTQLLCGVYSSNDPNAHAKTAAVPLRLTIHSDYTYRITNPQLKDQVVAAGKWHRNALSELIFTPEDGDKQNYQIIYNTGSLVPNSGDKGLPTFHRVWL